MTIYDCIHNVLKKIKMWVWEVWLLCMWKYSLTV